MTYATLLVHLQTGQMNTTLLNVAGHFAERFDAHVIGIAACQPMMLVSGDGTVCGEVFADDQRQLTADLEIAQEEFRTALQGRQTRLEWRSEITIAAPARFLANHASDADLIMTSSMPADTFDLSRAANPGSLVMDAGRPVFLVPSEMGPMHWDGALLAWKDTRECRRAAADALPLLKQIKRVSVLEIAAVDDFDAARTRVAGVVTWLGRHGIAADSRVDPANGNEVDQLRGVADELNVDVIVAGAYGHGRIREWAFGGVTRNLLLACKRGALISH